MTETNNSQQITNNQIIELADKEIKQKGKSKKEKKGKKKEQSPKNVLFVIFFITALLFAFVIRANRTRYEQNNPDNPYIKTTVTFPVEKIEEFFYAWKTRIEETLPDTLPKF